MKARDQAVIEMRKEAFLDALRMHGTVSGAVAATGIAATVAYRWRKSDPDFAKGWNEATEPLLFLLEDEAVRRALEGTPDGIYHLGKRIGERRVYSDALLVTMLKALAPEKYRDRAEVKHTGDLAERILRARARVGGKATSSG